MMDSEVMELLRQSEGGGGGIVQMIVIQFRGLQLQFEAATEPG